MDRVNSVEEFLNLYDSGEPTSLPFRVAAPTSVWAEIVREHPSLRESVAMNKTIPIEIIRQLANDANERVRSAIANKRKTPTDVLAMLAEDENESVRQRVALNPKVTRAILLMLADDEWEGVREAVAKRLSKLDGGE